MLSLGLLYFDRQCIISELARLGDEFSWAAGSEVQTEIQQETFIRKVDFKMKDWQRVLAIVTLSLNLIVLFMLAILGGYMCKNLNSGNV